MLLSLGGRNLTSLAADGVNFLMANDELRKSWKATEAFLLDARVHFSHTAEVTCCEELRKFSEFLGHNELELALDKT